MQRHLWAVLVLVGGCSETPQEALRHNVQVVGGGQPAGAAVIGEGYVVCFTEALAQVDKPAVLTQDGKSVEGLVVSKDDARGLSLVWTQTAKLKPAYLGEAMSAEKDAPLVSRLLNVDGTSQDVKGTSSGFKTHKGVAYLQTDLKVEPVHLGAGVYDQGGKLVGIIGLRRGPFSYVLPIEYIKNGVHSLANQSADLKRTIGVGTDSQAFAAKRAEAANQTEPMPDIMTFESISTVHGYGTKALLAELVMLDAKDGPVHDKDLKWAVMTKGPQPAEVIAQGVIGKADRRYTAAPELAEKIIALQEESFGAAHVAKDIAPYELGLLHIRVPLASFCPKVKGDTFYSLVVTLADERKSQEMVFTDMPGVCRGAGGADGDALLAEWGFGAMAASPAADEAEPKGKKRGKTGKKRPKKRGHKRGRR
jgi:hypothetical protein